MINELILICSSAYACSVFHCNENTYVGVLSGNSCNGLHYSSAYRVDFNREKLIPIALGKLNEMSCNK